MSESPFIPGAKVAIIVNNGFEMPISYRAGIVAKVHKNGNFVLEGNLQQWRPYPPGGYQKYWNAITTGTKYVRLIIWNEASEAQIEKQIALADCAKRYVNARKKIDGMPFSELVTEEIVTQLEAIVSALERLGDEPICAETVTS